MAHYEDGTMDVDVGGKLERRKYQVNTCRGHFGCIGNRYHLDPTAYEPEHSEAEEVIYTLGSDVPFIVRIR